MMAVAALLGAAAAFPFRLPSSGLLLGVFGLGALAVNIAASYQPMQSARTAALFLTYALAGSGCSRLGRRAKSRRFVIAAMILTGAALATHGLYQSLVQFGPEGAAAAGSAPEAIRARIESGRAVATMGLPGALAGFLAMTLPLTAGLAVGKGAVRVAALILLGIQGAGLLATRSASGVACLAAAAGIVLWLRGGEPAATSGRRRALAIGAVVAGLIAATALLGLRLSAPGAADEGSGPFALRAGNWKVALKIFEENPAIGAGLGTYGIAFPAHREWGMNEARHAHNSYLQLFAEGGVALGALALLLVCLMLARIARAAGEQPWLAAACLAFLLHNTIDFTFFLESTGAVFACAAGLLLGSTAGRPGAGAPEPPAAATRMVFYVPVLSLALFAFLAGRADAARDSARDLALERGAGPALPEARRAVSRNPFDPDSHALLSHLLLERGVGGDDDALAESEAEAIAAIDLDARTPHRWSHLADVRLRRGDPVGAYLASARAAELYPIEIRYREQRDAIAALIEQRAPAGP